MAKKIVFKKRFNNRLIKLLEYLKNEWGEIVASSFLIKLEGRLETLSEQPYIGAPSEIVKGLRGILISRHNKVFYKVTEKEIIIMHMQDTRMNPKKKKA